MTLPSILQTFASQELALFKTQIEKDLLKHDIKTLENKEASVTVQCLVVNENYATIKVFPLSL